MGYGVVDRKIPMDSVRRCYNQEPRLLWKAADNAACSTGMLSVTSQVPRVPCGHAKLWSKIPAGVESNLCPSGVFILSGHLHCLSVPEALTIWLPLAKCK